MSMYKKTMLTEKMGTRLKPKKWGQTTEKVGIHIRKSGKAQPQKWELSRGIKTRIYPRAATTFSILIFGRK